MIDPGTGLLPGEATLKGAKPDGVLVEVPGRRLVEKLSGKCEEQFMSAENKAGNMADKAKGKIKEAAGKAVGNERLIAEGKADQVKGDAKQAAEKAKDAFKD